MTRLTIAKIVLYSGVAAILIGSGIHAYHEWVYDMTRRQALAATWEYLVAAYSYALVAIYASTKISKDIWRV